MRVLGVLEPIDLLAALQFMRRRSHLAVGTTIAGATPIDATLQFPIHDKLMLVYQKFPLLLARAGKVRQEHHVYAWNNQEVKRMLVEKKTYSK